MQADLYVCAFITYPIETRAIMLLEKKAKWTQKFGTKK